jgi:hypothetical protein
MTVWLITGFGLDDWFYWQLLLQSLVITINYKNSQSIFSQTLLSWLSRTRSILVLCHSMTDFWFKSGLFIWFRDGSIENTASSIVVFTAGCIAMGVIQLLSVYSLPWECVYRVVAQQQVYMSQYVCTITNIVMLPIWIYGILSDKFNSPLCSVKVKKVWKIFLLPVTHWSSWYDV